MAKQEEWPDTLTAIGTMAAVQGVDVTADLPGVIEQDFVRLGQVRSTRRCARCSSTLGRNGPNWLPLEAQRDLARLNFDRMQGLLKENVISRAEYDRATADQRGTEARVGEIRATIERKTIRAPFSGVLGIRQVNLGQYLSDGEVVVSLQALNPIYVNFGVPQQTRRPGHQRAQGSSDSQVTSEGVAIRRSSDGDRFGRGRSHPQYSGAGDASKSWRHLAPWHVRSG